MNVQPKKLIIIGDSGVYGWGDNENGGWCESLRKKWMKEKNSPVIYSLGVRGDGLENVAKRWKSEWSVRGELRRQVPDGMLISIGINDTARIGRQDGRPQLSSEAFKFGLKQLLREMNIYTKIWVIGLTAVDENVMPFAGCLWYSNYACSIYESKIEATCLDIGIPFLPIHKSMINTNDWNELLTYDGLHLNSKGHRWVYEKIIKWKSLYNWATS